MSHTPNQILQSSRSIRKYLWTPVLTLLLGLGAAAAFVFSQPPRYASRASMWESEKPHMPESALFAEAPENYLGTQAGLLESGRLKEAALDRLRASRAGAVPLGKDGQPLGVEVEVRQLPHSAILILGATSADPAFSRDFLNSLMSAYQDYKRDLLREVSDETLASISDQVSRSERELNSEQNALTAFARTNNLAILQEEANVAVSYLAKLQSELSDLQLQSQLLQAAAGEKKPAAQTGDPTGQYSLALAKNLGSAALPDLNNAPPTPSQELELLKVQREKLSNYFRPAHPKMAALDEQIASGEKLLEPLRAQSEEQVRASLDTVKMKMDAVLASIQEWEAKVTGLSRSLAEAERLKQNVLRAQGAYDRLVTLLHNLDLSRNADQATLAILEPASPASRAYTRELRVLPMAALGGLGLGLGIVLVMGLSRLAQVPPLEIASPQGQDPIKSNAAERLEQLKGLLERGFLSQEAYDRKVAQIIDSL